MSSLNPPNPARPLFEHLGGRSRTAFSRVDVSAVDLEWVLRFSAEDPRHSWHYQKAVLLHRNCPESLMLPFLSSRLWYVRLTAGLAKKFRAKYCPTLFYDTKSTVRFSAYRTALVEGIGDSAGVARLLLEDVRAHGYLNSRYWSLEAVTEIAAGRSPGEVWDEVTYKLKQTEDPQEETQDIGT